MFYSLFFTNSYFDHLVVDFYFINHIHTLNHFTKYCVYTIQVRLRAVGYKELATTRIFSSVGHGQSTSTMFMWVYFAFDCVAWSSSTSTFWTSSLNYKVWDHSMKGQSIIKS